ncbi:MAG: hypothetical protein ABI891_04650 [Acidobacteriota bacterium]
MAGNASFKFKNQTVPEDHIVFDGNTGQAITLTELINRRTENQNQIKSKPVSDSLREKNRRVITSRLDALLEEDYDEDFLPPSPPVFDSVKKLLLAVTDSLGYEMSIPTFFIPDGEGGVRIEWKVNDKHLRLLKSEKRLYLYFEDNAHYDGIENFNPGQLVEKLRWLNH